MPNISRLIGRFFSVFILFIFAVALPHQLGAIAFPLSPEPASHFPAWSTARHFTRANNLLAALPASPAMSGFDSSSGLSLCQISDTVYRADGTPAQGTIVILWPAFTAANGQPVAPGTLAVPLGANGQFNASLAPNTGASPAGTYYRATYKLNDGSTNSEYWVVPAAQTSSISAIRSKLVPVNQAAQFLTRDFADSHYLDMASSQTVAGLKTFTSSPALPAPINPADAATKAYVDANAGSGNLASPPPIGNVTPNSGNFTTLTVQTTNGIPNPAGFPQADPCAKINAAIGSLPAAGGTIDVRTFAPGQTCNTTINATKPVTLLFGAGTWTFNGNPGINITAPNVSIECPTSAILQASSTVLASGGPYPLIANTVAGLHAADATSVTGCELNGLNVGTFGIFAPTSYSMKIHGVHAKLFSGACILATAAQNDMYNTVSEGCKADGVVWGPDGHISGMSQANGNLGDGWHIVSGGNVFDGPTAYLNRLHGMHLDGNEGGDWIASATYIEPKIIQPASNNPGKFAFYSQQTGVSSATPPTFCQTIGCVTRDNTVYWVNLGIGHVYGFPIPEWYQGMANINSPNISDSGWQAPAGDWDNILLEGSPTGYAIGDSILGAKVRQPDIPDYPAHGIHLKYTSITSIKDVQWQGGAWNAPQPAQPELGGVQLDNSYFTEIGYLSCDQSYGPCLSIAHSSNITIDKLMAQDGGVSGDPVANTYALTVDGNSGNTVVDNLLVTDSRGTPYQRGISNGAASGNLTVKNQKYLGLAATDTGNSYQQETLGPNGAFSYNVPPAAGYQWSVGGTAIGGINPAGIAWYSSGNAANSVTLQAPASAFSPYAMTWPTTPGASGQCLTSAGGGTAPMTWGSCSNLTLNSPPPIGSTTPNTINATALTYQNIPGVAFMVSRYPGIQDAINAAYNNGSVLGTVIDDRTSPYTGPGFIVYDSVTLKLAPTTYTINSTVTYNNGNNNVTAGIVVVPGARISGASASTNHGTILTAANGLNADLIATSTVGTGIGSTAQWWHWGGLEDLRIIGNGAHQTAGNCLNIENMGEVAFLRSIEVSACYLDNILFTGASATPSDIANITTNSAGRYGFNFNNLAGVAVVHGLSGDSNTTSLVRLNGGQSGTLTILGFKTEEEISGQDPLITIDQTGQSGAQPSLYIIGGYTFGRTGVSDVIRYVNGTAGSAPFISVNNFYVQNYVNAVNDTVNSRTTAAANMNKVPFYYGPTGAFFSGQAFTLDLNTFVQSPHSGNGILTEVFGTTSSNETLVAASGTSSSISTGGIGFRMPNRSGYGQSPELFAKMTYAFPGGNPNTQQWEFIPTKAAGDSSTRWIGDPGYRWDELYATDMNSTTATIGTLNVTTCNGCGSGTQQVNSDWNASSGVAQILNRPALAAVATSGSYNDLSNKPAVTPQGAHLVSGSMLGTTSTFTGNSSDQTIFTVPLPAGIFNTGAGVHCYAKWTHLVSSGAITYKWTLGTTTWGYGGYTSSSVNVSSDIEILTIASLSSQSVNLSPVIAGTAIGVGGSYGNAGGENLANASTLKLTFNAGSSDQIRGATFYCQTIQ